MWMHDIGFQPTRSNGLRTEVRRITRASFEQGLGRRPVRLIMLSAPFTMGVGLWAFYAFQPHLLDLYGDPNATWIAGTAAAVFAGARMVGGSLASRVVRLFSRRSSALAGFIGVEAAALIVVGVTRSFWVALVALVVASTSMSAASPIRQALLNSCISSDQRATVLSFDGLISSSGGVVVQPMLGKAADVWSYGTAYMVGGGIYALAAPFLLALRAMGLAADATGEEAQS
jgi:MFS family permease